MYLFLVDDRWRRQMVEDGSDLDVVLEEEIAADAAVLEEIPEGVTTGLHIWRRCQALVRRNLDPSDLASGNNEEAVPAPGLLDTGRLRMVRLSDGSRRGWRRR